MVLFFCCSWFVVWFRLSGVGCLSFVVLMFLCVGFASFVVCCWLLCVVSCLMFVVCCLLYAICC